MPGEQPSGPFQTAGANQPTGGMGCSDRHSPIHRGLFATVAFDELLRRHLTKASTHLGDGVLPQVQPHPLVERRVVIINRCRQGAGSPGLKERGAGGWVLSWRRESQAGCSSSYRSCQGAGSPAA